MKKRQKKHNCGGRTKLQEVQRKKRKLQMHVTESEYVKLETLCLLSGRKTMSDFMRDIILHEETANKLTNKMELLSHLDQVGREMAKIGNNINQLARYANIQIKSGKTDTKTIIDFIGIIDKYMQTRRDLTKANRSLVRNE